MSASSDVALDPSPDPSLVARGTALLRSRFLWSVGAQGLVSGFHFALNLVLLRVVTREDFGLFAFAFVLAMFASAINNALIATPLTVWTPVIKDPERRAANEALFGTLNVLLFAALCLAGVLCTLALGDAGPATGDALGMTAFVAMYAARQYSRSVGYARLRPLVTASGDATYVVVGATLVALELLRGGAPSIGSVLSMLALANAAAMLMERLRLHGGFTRFRLGTLRGYAEMWPQTRWALIGALTTLFLAQAHSIIVTWKAGPGAFAPLAAGFVLFGPVRIALMTWQNMVKPELAIALDEGRAREVRATLGRGSAVTAAAVALLAVALWLGWPRVHGFLYAERYADAPMAMIVGLWAAITLCQALYNAPSAVLQAMRDFRVLAIASVWAALLSGLLVALLLWRTAPAYTLLGVLAAETFMALYVVRTLLRRLDARVAATTVGPVTERRA